MKVTAIAYPIQGLIKYHGLRDPMKRLPYHDSISVCYDGYKTTTTIDADSSLKKDEIIINNEYVKGRALERVEKVLSTLKTLTDYKGCLRIVSQNSITQGKGLGFSASGFAALGKAASVVMEANIDHVTLSEIIRFGAGSATRSLAGGFALWYADKNGYSYAEQIAGPGDLDFKMVVVPIPSKIKTDVAHADVLHSSLFSTRVDYIKSKLIKMREAIRERNSYTISDLAEEDSLHLHAITMTGEKRMILWEPDTLRIIKEVLRMREEGIPVWYSHDTGPSLFLNTVKEHVDDVASVVDGLGLSYEVCGVGGEPYLIDEHLF